MRIGPRDNASCAPLQLQGCDLSYVKSFKHLGIVLVAAGDFHSSVDHLRSRFYQVFNSIMSKIKATNSDLVIIEMVKSCCLPFLLYGTESLSMTRSNCNKLDHCIDRVIYRLFGVSEVMNVKMIRKMFSLPSIHQLQLT